MYVAKIGALPLKNLLSVVCCLLLEFKCLKCGLLRPATCTDGAIYAFLLRRQRLFWLKNIVSISRVSDCVMVSRADAVALERQCFRSVRVISVSLHANLKCSNATVVQQLLLDLVQ